MSLRSLLISVCLVLGSIAMRPAHAHDIGLSRGDYRTGASGMTATLVFSSSELVSAIEGIDENQDGRIGGDELAVHRALLDQALRSGLSLRSEGNACDARLESMELLDEDGVQIVLDYRCASPISDYTLRWDLLHKLSPGHRHLATLSDHSGPTTRVLYASAPELLLSTHQSAETVSVGWPLIKLGVEHILTGFDHLVFLFGLLIVTSRLRDLVAVVTAFTLGHSITLGIATLGWWMPSSAWIEPLIALSIVYVGVENIIVRERAKRWPLTLAFGLVHGFGFAGVLSEIALPSTQLPLALLSFNVGVELGQLLVLAVALPLLIWARRGSWFVPRGVPVLSGLIACAGLAWFVERVV